MRSRSAGRIIPPKRSGSRFHLHCRTDGPVCPGGHDRPNVTAWSDGGLVPESNRCYKMRAILVTFPKLRYSGFSNTACATTLPLPYSPPSMSGYTRAVERPGSGVEVVWSDVSGNEDGFRIEMSDHGLASWAAVGTVGPNTTSFMAAFPLCYRVFAFNASGDSQSPLPGCTAPAALTNLAATVIGGGAIELTWTDNSAVEDEYQVSYGHYGCESEGNTNEWLIASLPANSTSFLTGPATYSGYTYDYYAVGPLRGELWGSGVRGRSLAAIRRYVMPPLRFKSVALLIVAAASGAYASAAPPPPKEVGYYDSVFIFDTHTNNLVLRAHVTNSNGLPATDGVVVFEYCSYKGLPPRDITRAGRSGPAAHVLTGQASGSS